MALTLDPTYHLAYQHIVDSYTGQTISKQFCVSAKCTIYVAVLRPSGDSLLIVPLAIPRDSALLREHLEDFVRRGAKREFLRKGKDIAERWVAANPSEGRARLMFATTLVALGDIAAADSNLRGAVILDSSNAGYNAMFLKLEIAIKSGQAAAAAKMYDSIRANPFTVPGTGGRVTTGGIAVIAAPVFGRYAQYDSLMTVGMTSANVGPVRERLSREAIKMMMGAPSDSFPQAATAFYEQTKVAAGSAAATKAVVTLLGDMVRRPVDAWPAIDTSLKDVRVAPIRAALRKDTTALRSAARGLDSLSTIYVGALLPDSGVTLAAAVTYLTFNDSLHALQMTRRWLDSIATYTPMLLGQTGSTFVQAMFPRAVLMRADLAAGLGFKAEARVWYDRFLGYWDKADPQFQPIVERARKSRAALVP